MGAQSARIEFGAAARIAALMAAALALANCSSATRVTTYSPKVVADGEPVPKGGGVYKVGKPYRLNGRTYHPSDNPPYRSEGIASWYGPDFHGRLTANGEVFDMHSLSAAHPTMPMPSYARVTNLENGRSIIVRVNDRGPYARNRVIDLSIGAAKALRFYGKGLARVRVEYVGRAPLEGSDDRALMATLRTGRPAPPPASVRLASARPFVPFFAGRQTTGATPVPAERPFGLGSSQSARKRQGAPTRPSSGHRPRERSVVSLPTTAEPRSPLYEAAADPAFSATALGLMSGRGLY
jgi:peptidoglycan lytic transglycosylase